MKIGDHIFKLGYVRAAGDDQAPLQQVLIEALYAGNNEDGTIILQFQGERGSDDKDGWANSLGEALVLACDKISKCVQANKINHAEAATRIMMFSVIAAKRADDFNPGFYDQLVSVDDEMPEEFEDEDIEG